MIIGVLPGELSGKAIAKCFWHCEVENELLDHNLRDKWLFSTKKSCTLSGTFDDAMQFIDQKCCEQLYLHNCSDHCKAKGTWHFFIGLRVSLSYNFGLSGFCSTIFIFLRLLILCTLPAGCGQLYVADGNWKLRYAHCMWKVPIDIPGFGKINYPSVCPLSPKRGHAFCHVHCERAHALGYPTDLKKFLSRCGVEDGNIDKGLFVKNVHCCPCTKNICYN